jgi:hypothetical protein
MHGNNLREYSEWSDHKTDLIFTWQVHQVLIASVLVRVIEAYFKKKCTRWQLNISGSSELN